MSQLTNEGMVYAAALSPPTRLALEKYSFDNGFNEWLGDRDWIAGEWFAWSIALLKVEADTPELFPKGKWATIQRMEGLLAECAQVTVKARAKVRTR